LRVDTHLKGESVKEVQSPGLITVNSHMDLSDSFKTTTKKEETENKDPLKPKTETL
jgi:hypothetical protein